jgi:pyridoxine 4-dehydrogenase
VARSKARGAGLKREGIANCGHRPRTSHYNVGARTGGDLLRAAEDTGTVFSPWHPITLTEGPDTARVMAVVEPIASRHQATPRQIALAWQLQHSPVTLPIPGTSSIAHLRENLDGRAVGLTGEETAAITALAAEG